MLEGPRGQRHNQEGRLRPRLRFIAAEDGKEYFFHRSGLTPSLDFDRLAGGERVSFEIEANPKGDRAKNVQAA
jgi:cold shock CspA family protein